MRDKKNFWFGTPYKMQWINAPLSPAEMSPEGWNTSGTYLRGGGFSRQSRATHKNYIFEWPGSSSREMAQLMKDYRDGVWSSHGNPLIYFIDPLIYDQNILPAGWAAPGQWVTRPGTHTPIGVCDPEERSESVDLPVVGAKVLNGSGRVLATAKPSSPLHFTLYYSGTFSGDGVKVNGVPLTEGTVVQGAIKSTSRSFSSGSTGLVDLEVSGSGFTVWGMKMSHAPVSGWTGGMGHSGVQFVGEPTYMANTGVNDGQIGYAATFKETGSWIR